MLKKYTNVDFMEKVYLIYKKSNYIREPDHRRIFQLVFFTIAEFWVCCSAQSLCPPPRFVTALQRFLYYHKNCYILGFGSLCDVCASSQF